MDLRDQLEAKIKRNVKWVVGIGSVLVWLFLYALLPGLTLFLTVVGGGFAFIYFAVLELREINRQYEMLKRVMAKYDYASKEEPGSYVRRNVRVDALDLGAIQEWVAKFPWRKWLYNWAEKVSGFTEEWRREKFPEHHK